MTVPAHPSPGGAVKRLGVWLMAALTLSSCAPNIYGRGPTGQDIPFVWNAAVQPVPLTQTTEATPPEQYVSLSGCPRSAVQLRYVRQYGEEEARAACLSALSRANQNAQGAGLVLGLPLIPLVVALLYFLLRPFSLV